MGYLILGIIILAAILIFGGYIVLSVMNYYRSELDFGTVTMQWFKRTAMVQKDGKITKVSLNRVYDVKESL